MEEYLNRIVSYLETHPVALSYDNADGRVNSGINENEILEVLEESPLGGIIERPNIRAWYDFAVSVNGRKIFINIKVSDLSNRAADNLSSKKGMGYALTGDTNLPDQWPAFNKAIRDNLKGGFDYYFLVVNKNNPRDVFWTSLKRIPHLQANGNNLPFQCDWGANRERSNRSEEEAIEYILEVYLNSWDKKINGYPDEIKTMLDRGEIHSKLHYTQSCC